MMESAHRMMVDTLKGMMQLAFGLQANKSRRIQNKGFDIQANAQAAANTYASTLAVMGATPDEHNTIRAEFNEIVNPLKGN